jgi:hypothetical protein
VGDGRRSTASQIVEVIAYRRNYDNMQIIGKSWCGIFGVLGYFMILHNFLCKSEKGDLVMTPRTTTTTVGQRR